MIEIIKKIIVWWFKESLIFPNGIWFIMAGFFGSIFLRFLPAVWMGIVFTLLFIVIIFLTVIGGMFVQQIRGESSESKR